MTIKTILVAASGGAASDGAIELGCRLARKFEAHLEAYHVLTDVREILLATGEGFGMPMSGELIDRITADAAGMAAKTKAGFEAALARHAIALAASPGKTGASGGWREASGYGPYLVAQRARFFDLVVLGRSERVVDQPHSDAVEQTLLQSGRPVLLAPAKPPQALGDSIAFGWNGEAAAVRALAGSLPLLAAARAVNVIVVGEKHQTSAAAVVEHLAWHGIKASLRPAYAVEGVGPGEQLLAEARDAGADLLVMGGYGHRPWREALFGGATRQIVGVSLLPILLSH